MLHFGTRSVASLYPKVYFIMHEGKEPLRGIQTKANVIAISYAELITCKLHWESNSGKLVTILLSLNFERKLLCKDKFVFE